MERVQFVGGNNNSGGGGSGPTSRVAPSSPNNNHNKSATTIVDDDDDSALDPSEQTLRPIDNAFNQQRVNAWHPILDPVWFMIGLLYLGVILIPTGLKIYDIQKNVVEMKLIYDDFDNYTFADPPTNKIIQSDTAICGIGNNFNMNRTCNLTFVTTEFLTPPVLVHYELRNFHQNHRNYFKSFDTFQIRGENIRNGVNQDPISAENCRPLNKLGDIQLNPCGLIANTFFNDYFELLEGKDAFGQDLVLIEDGIAWESDLRWKFKQPIGFNYSECDSCDDMDCCRPGDSCTTPYYNKKDGKCYRFFYPDDNITQYLYETYPNKISPLEGVTSEHFVVWMRVAALSQFRKLYGYFDQPIAPNTTLTFQVNANFVVARIEGGKSLVIGTTSIFGGKNDYLWKLFLATGLYCVIVGLLIGIKQYWFPRKIADPKYLHFKED